MNEEKLIVWTEIQLGNSNYTSGLQKWIKSYIKNDGEGTKESEKELKEITEKLEKLGITLGSVISNEELSAKANESGGGFLNIGFIEEKYNDFVKTKRGNDNTYYKTNLSATLSAVKAVAYKKASFYHKKYAYEHLPDQILKF